MLLYTVYQHVCTYTWKTCMVSSSVNLHLIFRDKGFQSTWSSPNSFKPAGRQGRYPYLCLPRAGITDSGHCA